MKDRIATIGVWLVLATLIASVDINHRKRQESKRIDRLEKDVAEMRHDILANDATAFNRSLDSLHAITNLQVRLLRIWEQIYAIKGLPLPPESKP